MFTQKKSSLLLENCLNLSVGVFAVFKLPHSKKIEFGIL